MTRALVLLSLVLPACIVVETGGPVTVPCCMANEGARLSTTSVHEDAGISISMTDVDGPTACSMSENPSMELGFAGSQLFVRLDTDMDWGCPEGTFPLDNESCGGDGVGFGCARLRTWDSAGRLVEEHFSVSGAVIVEDTGFDKCRYTVEAVLPGGAIIEGESVLDDLDWFDQDSVCQ